jgi:predicted HNH restriction endonuclease
VRWSPFQRFVCLVCLCINCLRYVHRQPAERADDL